MTGAAQLFFILLLFISSELFAQGKELPRLIVRGNKFMTEEGKPIIFRGLNTSDPNKLIRNGHWDKAYFEALKSWGANIVRFPVHPTAWRAQGKENYIKLLDQGIAWAEEQGMYVIIDWHVIGNLRTELYQNASYETTQKETFEFWRTMANQYKDNTTVAMFELFNEPTTIHQQLGRCSWAQWKEFMEEIIVIVRANGAKTIPLVAGFNWAYDLKPVAKDPIKAEGIAYVSHPYPMKCKQPWEKQWTSDWAFAAKKYPVILTEIGFSGSEEKGAHIPVISDESYGEAITKFCNERGISYTVWVFDPDWSPMLFSDWDYTPTRQGKFFKKALLEAQANK